jgi:hypothetical protein
MGDAKAFVLGLFQARRASLGFGEIVRRGATSAWHFSADETRAAIASLVDSEMLVLTYDLKVRARRG